VVNEHLLLGDPLLDKLYHFDRLPLRLDVLHVEVLEGVVDRFYLNLVQLRNNFLASFNATGHNFAAVQTLFYSQLGQGPQEEAESDHEGVEVYLQGQGRRI